MFNCKYATEYKRTISRDLLNNDRIQIHSRLKKKQYCRMKNSPFSFEHMILKPGKLPCSGDFGSPECPY